MLLKIQNCTRTVNQSAAVFARGRRHMHAFTYILKKNKTSDWCVWTWKKGVTVEFMLLLSHMFEVQKTKEKTWLKAVLFSLIDNEYKSY
jgi:hypothetical protein